MPAYDDSRFAPPAPIAMVNIRHPDRTESVADANADRFGADATLLPRSSVESLGIVGTGERYQLAAFDGTTSESEAVRADLIFLNKKFRGRYLLIDGEVGVIGRDILNHIRLLLDGVASSWEEWTPPGRNA